MSFVDDLKANLNPILGVRDTLGAALKPVYLVTRTWGGSEPGDGEATDTVVQILPSPRVVELMADSRIRDGGAVKEGDIFLKALSKQTFATEDLIDGTSPSANIEKLYKVGSNFYQVVKSKEKLLTWEVHLRRMSDQSSYPAPL